MNGESIPRGPQGPDTKKIVEDVIPQGTGVGPDGKYINHADRPDTLEVPRGPKDDHFSNRTEASDQGIDYSSITSIEDANAILDEIMQVNQSTYEKRDKGEITAEEAAKIINGNATNLGNIRDRLWELSHEK